MTTTLQAPQTVATWPLARRVVSGFVQPGGRASVARAVEGAAIDEGSRLVELAPGPGLTTDALLAGDPRSWTGVEPDERAAAALGKAHRGAGRTVVTAPPDATGLEEGSATAVVADALLSTLSADGRAAVLAESARLLRAGGRVALIDVAPAPGAERDPGLRADLEAAGIALLDVAAWRALIESAGLVVVGSLTGALHLPAPRDLAKAVGPRAALTITREVALDAALRGPALAARAAIPRQEVALRSVVVVGEMPLILGMRRPRR